MDWKPLLRGIIGLVVPMVWTFLITKRPDLPVTADILLEIVLWGVGLLIGGWQANNIVRSMKLK